MDLVVPDVNIAPRSSRTKLGHFVGDVGYDGFAHYLDAYRDAFAHLPPVAEVRDVPTTFGSVRTYRFDGPKGRPVVLLPGRNASTPMWAANLPGLLTQRTVYCVDLLGEPGLSVQQRPLTNAAEQADWFDDVLTGMELESPHLMGASFGGWSAVNYAVRKPGRVASLVLLDPVMTFARIPFRMMLAAGLIGAPSVPEVVRRRMLSWMSGGTEVDDSVPEARLVAAGTVDFVLRQPAPTRFTDEQLRALDLPVLALIAGRSVIHDGTRAAETARRLLRYGSVELWPDASHAINGDHPERVAERAEVLWGTSRS